MIADIVAGQCKSNVGLECDRQMAPEFWLRCIRASWYMFCYLNTISVSLPRLVCSGWYCMLWVWQPMFSIGQVCQQNFSKLADRL
jgi:hypothetical protein